MRRIKYLFESLRLKNAAFDLDVASHIRRIEFVSVGNVAMGTIKLIFFFSRVKFVMKIGGHC